MFLYFSSPVFVAVVCKYVAQRDKTIFIRIPVQTPGFHFLYEAFCYEMFDMLAEGADFQAAILEIRWGEHKKAIIFGSPVGLIQSPNIDNLAVDRKRVKNIAA